MSTLVILIPERQRLRARGAGGEATDGSRSGQEYVYALSPDGLALQTEGQCAAALLPKATHVVAVLSDTDVAWHRITLPKAPAARLRAALDGVLEEALLDEPDAVHLAIAPLAVPGEPTWIAAVEKRWLRAELTALEKAEMFVDRVVPMAWPDDPPMGHFAETHADAHGPVQGIALNWAHVGGMASVRLQGGLARTLVPTPAPAGTRWSASPGAAAAAEQWLGAPVNVMSRGQRLLQAARSLWNLRQFELARRTRGSRALRDSLRQFSSAQWRPVRLGLATLVLAQVVGLNMWAWHQREAMATKRAEMQSLVKAAFPRVSDADLQRDAAAVLQREAQALRTLAGKPGENDFETMLQAAAAAWPGGVAPVENLRFELGKLTLGAPGWSEPQVEQFRSLLRPSGWQVEAAQGRLTLSRARTGSPS
jgi:general secretion pathway protein L